MKDNQSPMTKVENRHAFDLSIFILNHGEAEKAVKFAKSKGVRGASIVAGKGTRKNAILSFLGLDEIRRDLILTVTKEEETEHLREAFKSEYGLEQPGKGIAVTIPLSFVLGTYGESWSGICRDREYGEYNAMLNIVDVDQGQKVVEIANDMNITGATLINARGTADTAKKIFDFPIEPAKDMVLVIEKREKIRKLAVKIREAFEFDKANTGIQFIFPVSKTIGLYQGNAADDQVKLKKETDDKTEDRVYNINHDEYYALHVITKPEDSDRAAELAKEAGAGGATVIAGRGSGAYDTETLFNIPIQPRMDIVITVIGEDVLREVGENIVEELQLDKPGHGIIYCVKLLDAYGMSEKIMQNRNEA